MTRTLLLLLLAGNYCWALPFNTMDARAMAMGGTGTASAKPASASLFNPALLSVYSKKKGFSLVFPNVTGRSIYKKAHYQAFKNLTDNNYGSQLSSALTALNTLDSANFENQRTIFNHNATELLDKLNQLKDQSMSAAASPARISFSSADAKIGFSLYLNTQAFTEISPSIVKCDTQLLQGYITVLNEVDGGNPAFTEEKNIQLACNERIESLLLIDPTNNETPILNLYQQDGETPTLISKIHLAGIAIGEIGLTLSHQFNFGGMGLALGITPKIMRFQTVYAYPGVKSLTQKHEKISVLLKKRSNKIAFNADIGMALNVSGDDSLIAGLAIMNLLNVNLKNDLYEPLEEEKQGHHFKMNTQVRVGVVWQRAPFVLALDIDLSENLPVYSADKTQYVSIGAEYAFGNDVLKVRAGGKNNMQNNADISLSTGFALELKPFHLDLGLEYGFKSIGAGLQFGLDF